VSDDRRLIEDYLPIQAISTEASREKSIRKGHISTLHLWWARRPLVACRAAVYSALVPASRFQPANGPEEKRGSLGRANAAKFVERLCKYPGDARVIAEAQQHILEAHAERLTQEKRAENGGTGILPVTVEDILQDRAPRPKVLDMFAGGGAIPLEALRLGCEAYALDLNPVAHIIELCTLVYPQKYGKPDPAAKGSAKDGTWAGLAEEVRYWGQWVLKKVKTEIGDLYPSIPDPNYQKPGGPGFQPGSARSQPGHSHLVQGDLFTRRNLPHWQIGGSTYFVTFRTKDLELPSEARKLVFDACRYFDGQRYTLWTAVVMPDHVHLLLQPKEQEPGQWWSLSDILHSIKSFTANQINKLLKHEGSVWQDESFDRIVRDEEEFLEKWNYIRNNPVKRGLCSELESWDAFYERGGQASVGQALVEQASSLLQSPGKMPVPPNHGKAKPGGPGFQSGQKDLPGYLTPVAYLWTRTVRCKNPSCGATVPLVKQTWLCKKKGRYAALKLVAQASSLGEHSQDGCATKKVRFEVVEADSEKGLGFDPAAFSKGGNATCPFCGTVADADYVQTQGKEKRVGAQLMAVVCTQPATKGKTYLSASDLPVDYLPDEQMIRQRIDGLCKKTGLLVPHEPISPSRPSPNARGLSAVTRHGLTTFGDLFTSRQMLCLLTFVAAVREAHQIMVGQADPMVGQASSLSQSPGKMPGLPTPRSYDGERARAVATYLSILVDRLADYNSALCHWHNTRELIGHTFGRQALPMVWDFSELAPFGDASGSPEGAIEWIVGVAEAQANTGLAATVSRGSATTLPWPDAFFDAVITDPPYYDNVPYADISDFFYVWLKRTIGHLYPEHFATELTPKKTEATALSSRHGGDMKKATAEYERMMLESFQQACRVLKPDGQMVVVYAHKTTLGWATLVDAMRRAGFTVTEAWPLDTEMGARLLAMDTAALASSIFLVARKRNGSPGFQPGRFQPVTAQSTGKMPVPPSLIGSYEDDVRPELERIVRERVETLWEMGIVGADLVIAAVGAGLRAFTRFERVEYANGEEVPAEKFLAEVEGVVLETLLEKIFDAPRSGVAAVDGPSRFYVLWRYTYKAAELDAGEAIVFTYAQPVELDGQRGLSSGSRALVEKKKAKYRLRDFTERGDEVKLGLPDPQIGMPAPLIDVLHRVLWLMENEPRALGKFLEETRPDRERLRLVAQALAGAGLKGKAEEGAKMLVTTTAAEQAALGKLLANWRTLIESSAIPLFELRS
jgi:putative DNA methylase